MLVLYDSKGYFRAQNVLRSQHFLLPPPLHIFVKIWPGIMADSLDNLQNPLMAYGLTISIII